MAHRNRSKEKSTQSRVINFTLIVLFIISVSFSFITCTVEGLSRTSSSLFVGALAVAPTRRTVFASTRNPQSVLPQVLKTKLNHPNGSATTATTVSAETSSSASSSSVAVVETPPLRSPYNFVWYRRVWLPWIAWTLASFVFPPVPIPTVLSTAVAEAVDAWILPLLASSCCVVQMALNLWVSGMGCAGFNTVLGGPLVRSFFLAVLLRRTIRAAVASSVVVVVSWTLALLPELVHFWNVLRVMRSRGRLSAATATEATTTATIRIRVPTMGCVACVNKIDSVLESQLRKHDADHFEVRSWLSEKGTKGGVAEVRVMGASSSSSLLNEQAIILAIEEAGFPNGTLISREYS